MWFVFLVVVGLFLIQLDDQKLFLDVRMVVSGLKSFLLDQSILWKLSMAAQNWESELVVKVVPRFLWLNHEVFGV